MHGYSAVQATRLAMPVYLAEVVLLTIKLQVPNRMTARQGEGSLPSHLTWRCLSGADSGDGGVSSGAPTLVAHSSCRFICETPVAVYSALQPLQQQRARAQVYKLLKLWGAAPTGPAPAPSEHSTYIKSLSNGGDAAGSPGEGRGPALLVTHRRRPAPQPTLHGRRYRRIPLHPAFATC